MPRTTAQIQQAMDAPLPVDPTPPGLIGYYDFAQNSLANEVQGSPFGPATIDADATGTDLSATDVVAGPSTIPADPFDGVTRLDGYRNFAPYLAIPYSNFAPKRRPGVRLEPGSSTRSRSRWAIPSSSRSPAASHSTARSRSISSASPPTRPTATPTPCWSATRSSCRSSGGAITNLVKNSMAAALIAPASGTYLIRISDPAQNNSDDSHLEMQFSVLPGNSNSLLTLMGTQTVQGSGGMSVATYTDPAALPGATIDQLLPTSDPEVAAEQQQAYNALVQAAENLVGNSVGFTDFLNLNTGVTIDPKILLGLQGNAPLRTGPTTR